MLLSLLLMLLLLLKLLLVKMTELSSAVFARARHQALMRLRSEGPWLFLDASP